MKQFIFKKINFFCAFVVLTIPSTTFAQYKPTTFQGYVSQGQVYNTSKLQSNIAKRDNYIEKTYEKYAELIKLIGQKRMEMSPDPESSKWFEKNIEKYINDVDEMIEKENYGTAYTTIIKHMGDVYSNIELSERIRIYKEYKEVVDLIIKRQDLTYEQKNEWMEKYKYKFVPMYNSEGKVYRGRSWIEVGGPNNSRVIIP